MKFILLIFLAIVPVSHCNCIEKTDCRLCLSSNSGFKRCRWCPQTNTCHDSRSTHNKCKRCSDATPNCSFTYAKKCDKVKSGLFHPFEAFNATLYSALAYTDDPIGCANKIFKEDLTIVDIIGRKCNFHFEYKECLAITAISHSMEKIIVAYRGTTSNEQLIDEFLSILKPKVNATVGGHLQWYFRNANNQLCPCVQSSLKDLVAKYPTYRVIVAGHSLGGAVASIASAQLVFNGITDKEKTTLYTFGMPRPGDRKYAKIHDTVVTKSWRVVHYNDSVAGLPPMLTNSSDSPYHHQREIFYGQNMSVLSDYTECFNYEDESCGRSVSSISLEGIKNHEVYYGIKVGSHCDNVMHRRQKRSNAESDMSHHFIEKECKRVSVADIDREKKKQS